MSKEDTVTTDLGLADALTMDQLVRTVVAQMFENDNEVATLEVVLNGTDAATAPKLEIELKLVSINGKPTRSDTNAAS
jgi:hypothetical protein